MCERLGICSAYDCARVAIQLWVVFGLVVAICQLVSVAELFAEREPKRVISAHDERCVIL